ncbi:MAG: efflux RND transporter permease subunit [Pirellulaceae bacterium]
MHPIEACVRNPVKVAVGAMMLALFGFIALFRMPMQLIPEVQTPTITIETRWPGASPQEVEREITQEQEEQLKSVEGVTKMTSESMDSMGRITMEFYVGTNMEEALLKVNSRLQQVPEYPEDADEPVISTSSASDRPIAWFILGARRPDDEVLNAFAAKRPDLAADVRKIATTENAGLAMLRLRKLAEAHPEAAELLPQQTDVTKLRRYCEDVIEARFERVSGVSNSNVMGGLEEELQVVVDPQKLAARQLTLGELRTRLRLQNKDTSAGDYWEGKRRYVVRTLSQFNSSEEVESQVIAVRDGVPVFVRDVAEVRLGYKKPDGMVRRFGTSSIAINALRETGANVLDVMDGLREASRELNEEVLVDMGLELTQVYDETEYIYSAVGLVNENIIIGSALTMMVLMLFLHLGARTLIFAPLIGITAVAAVFLSPWLFVITAALILAAGFWFARGALVVGLAIPTSIIGTFLMLNLMGRSLNVISLAGMAFAVGMLVDNAVVVLENIYRHHQLGKGRFDAAVAGAKEVWGAVVASTLTTLAVFLPVLFVEEEAGQLFRDIALAISSAVGLSLLVSVTLIPTASARLLSKRHAGRNGNSGEDSVEEEDSLTEDADDADEVYVVSDHHRLHEGNGDGEAAPERSRRRFNLPKATQAERAQAATGAIHGFGERFVNWIVAMNAWTQATTMRRLGVVFSLLLLSFGISWLMWPKVEYLPTGNRNLVFGIILPPPGYNLDELVDLGQIVEEELRPYWDVDPDSPEANALPYPAIGDFFYVARGRQVFLGVRAADATRAGDLIPLVMSVRDKLHGTFVVAKQSSLFEQGLTAGRTVDIEITGPELPKLVGIGGMMMGKLMNPKAPLIPGAQARPVPSLDLSSPEIHIEPKVIQAESVGVNASDMGYSIDAWVDGAYATDYFVGGDKIDLTIIGSETTVNRFQDLPDLPIATPSGELLTLSTVAEITPSSGPEQVNHRERQRAITIEVSPPPEVALEDALAIINREILEPLRDSGELRGGYRVALSGTADKLRDTWLALRWNVLIALLITYLLMAALFESWTYPFVIILSVPLGAVGGIVALRMLSWYLRLTHQPPQALDVLTMLGFVILIGTVVNNAILIVHQSLNLMREENATPNAAILESVRTRIRPIFMTTLTTVLGLSPLVLFPGAGSELYRGLGSVVLGGLFVSTVFTLIFVPTLFSLMMDVREAFFRMLGRSTSEFDLEETADEPTRERPVHALHA